jgi:hypothetical protein
MLRPFWQLSGIHIIVTCETSVRCNTRLQLIHSSDLIERNVAEDEAGHSQYADFEVCQGCRQWLSIDHHSHRLQTRRCRFQPRIHSQDDTQGIKHNPNTLKTLFII